MPNSRKPVRRKAPTGKRLRRPLDKRSIALEDLAATLQSSRIVVVYVSPGGPPDPDLVLPMFSLFGRTVWVDISKYVGPPAAFWTQVLNAQLGHVSREIRPGYYLFIDSTACAYQSGLIDFKRDQLAVGVGAFAAAMGVLDDRPSWVRAGATMIGAAAAWRVISAFMAVIAERNEATAQPQPPPPHRPPPPGSSQRTSPPPPRSAPPPPAPPPPPIDDVAVAFETMGLAPSSTYPEVKARYRDLAKRWHPDRSVGHRTNADDAGVRMTQINVAYSVIRAARGW